MSTHDTPQLSPPEPATLRNSVTSIEKGDVMSNSPTVADLPTLDGDQKSLAESQVTRTPGEAVKLGDPEKDPEGTHLPGSNVLSEMGPVRKNVLLFGFVSTSQWPWQ